MNGERSLPEPNNNFNEAMTFLLSHEGTTFVNDPDDLGGATKFGITWRFQQTVLPKYGITSVEQLPNMTRDQAVRLYKNEFWIKLGINRIKDSKVATKLLDISAGFPNIVEQMGGVARINEMDPQEALRLLASTHRDLFLDSIKRHPRNVKFEKGWMRRAAESPTGEIFDFDPDVVEGDDSYDTFFKNLYICEDSVKALTACNFNFGPPIDKSGKEVDRVLQFSGWLRKEFNVS